MMHSRTLLNVALLLIAVLLAALVYVSTQQRQTPSTDTRLTRLRAAEVTRIDIHHNARHIELQKTADGWQMLQPINIRANAFRIDTLLSMLDTTSHASYAAGDLDLDKYGLSETTTSIRFNDEALHFGTVNPINNQRYVLVDSSVHLIDDHFYPLLSSQTGTLVARELIDRDASIDRLELPDLTLYRDQNKRWQSSRALDPDAINELLYHWKHGQAFGVHNYMPRKSIAVITVFMEGRPDPVRLHITDDDPWLVIARPDLDIEYHFNLEFYDRLLKPGADSQKAGANDADTEAVSQNGR